MNRTTLLTLVALGTALSISTAQAQAATIDWDGGGDGVSYMDGANWVGGNIPADSDFTDNARFGNTAASPTTVTGPSSRRINTIIFQNTGWTINGGTFETVRRINSSGIGINTINTMINTYGASNQTWNIGTGNTLVLGNVYQRGREVTLTGGGTLQFTSRIDGFGGPVGWYGIRAVDGVVVVDSNSPYVDITGGAIFIAGETGALELMTDVSTAQGLIGTRIIDEYGIGLQVNDIGGGYVRITPIPEPASIVLAMAGGLMLLGRRRR